MLFCDESPGMGCLTGLIRLKYSISRYSAGRRSFHSETRDGVSSQPTALLCELLVGAPFGEKCHPSWLEPRPSDF